MYPAVKLVASHLHAPARRAYEFPPVSFLSCRGISRPVGECPSRPRIKPQRELDGYGSPRRFDAWRPRGRADAFLHHAVHH
eukprot:7357500-Pyramimonas_sp.AAC.1